MRDRETDSWWSIMTADAIGGPLAGTALSELPVGEKTTWKDWLARHPGTEVLSVDGREHEESNPYDNYFASDATFRDLEVKDRRLPAKEPVFTFHLDGRPYAVPHRTFVGGRILPLAGEPTRFVLLHRAEGAAIYASTEAWLVTAEAAGGDRNPERLLAAARPGASPGIEPLAGFDTFWYTWVAVNRDTELLQ